MIDFKQLQRKINTSDEYYTPEYGVKPILKYLKPNSTIWCPFDTEESKFVKLLKENGHTVYYSHIDIGLDFFTTKIGYDDEVKYNKNSIYFYNENDPVFRTFKDIDYIISNPPFSLKTQIIEKLINFGIPFAMLLPINILEGIERFKQFRKTNIELLMFDRRIAFENGLDPTKKSSPCVATMYLCSNILPEKLIFEELKRS